MSKYCPTSSQVVCFCSYLFQRIQYTFCIHADSGVSGQSEIINKRITIHNRILVSDWLISNRISGIVLYCKIVDLHCVRLYYYMYIVLQNKISKDEIQQNVSYEGGHCHPAHPSTVYTHDFNNNACNIWFCFKS